MLTYGFYNSINDDRPYDAIDMSSIFDGIIKDGVFMHVGDRFVVTQGSGMTVKVGSGRAWFNHTWTLNNGVLPITLENGELLTDRIDAVVLEINATDIVRANSIRVIKGLPSSNPVRPSMIRSEFVNQYALAYVYVKKGATSITTADIQNVVGQSPTPYVTAPLQTISIEAMISQWEAQWAQWNNEQKNTYISWFNGTKSQWSSFLDGKTSEFQTWFNGIKNILNDDVAAVLASEVQTMSQQVTNMQSQVTNAVNKVNALTGVSEIKVTTDGWVEDAVNKLFTKQITKSGILTTHNPIVDLIYKKTNQDEMSKEKDAYSLIEKIETGAGFIKLTTFEKPVDNFTIRIKGV